MNFELKPLNLVALANEKADLLVLLIAQDFKPGKDELSILIGKALKQGDFSAKLGTVLARDLLQRLASGDASGLDASTAGLLNRLRG